MYSSPSGDAFKWVGWDLGSRHVVTRVGWQVGELDAAEAMTLGVFEGANSEDFIDALPLYIIDRNSTHGQATSQELNGSPGVRYVRYVSPNGGQCNLSDVAFYGYEGEGDSARLYRPTNLPCIVIHTKNNKDPWNKENYVECMATVLGDDGSVLQDTAGLRYRGNASMQFPKKPYRLKFAHKHHVLGSPANARNWTLINNYGDKTLMRNIVAFRISQLMQMPYTPFCKAVDLIYNGEYKGCYQLCDKVEVKNGRVDVQKMLPEDIDGEALTGGYLWEIDNQGAYEKNWFRSQKGIWGVLHYPDPDEIVEEQKAYIKSYFQTVEDAVYAASADNTAWRQYIDFTTFAKYFLINQLCGNIDLYWSTYMYKQRSDSKVYCGPVWDFDIAFDNDYRVYPTANQANYSYGSGGENATFAKHVLFADSQTTAELAEYWREARTGGIDEAGLIALVDSVATALEESQRLNFMRWPILSEKVHMNPVALGSYSAEVERLKDYIAMRIGWMDSKLGYSEPADQPTTVEQTIAPTSGCSVYNVHGQLLYRGTSMPDLPEGVYIIRHNGQVSKLIR